MNPMARQGRRVVVTATFATATFVCALLLTVLQMPEKLAIFRPAWVALVLLYWCMTAPELVGVVVGWTAGLLLDVMTGTLLGQHALGLSIIAYIMHRTHRRVRVLPLWRQAITIFGLVILYQILVLWSNGIRGMPVMFSAYWISPLVSVVFWLWIYEFLQYLGRRCNVVS